MFNKKNFLHSIPVDIEAKYKLNDLLNLCANFNLNHMNKYINRLHIVNDLVFKFNKIQDDFLH